MAFNLSLLGASGGGGGVLAYDLLETTTLSSSASSVTFSGLGAYSDYAHLQIRMVARSTATGSNQNGKVFFNSDLTFYGGNYWTHTLEGSGSSVSPGSGNYTAPFQLGGATIVDAWSAAVLDILDFSSSSKNTTTRSLNGWASANVPRIYLRSTSWNNTDPVTTIKIEDATGLAVGSRFSLYGIKGA